MTDNSSTHNIHRQSGWRRAIPVFISLLILGMALHALSGHFTNHGYHQIRLAFKAFTTWQIVLTLVLGLCSYACLVGFDWIGLQRTGKRPHPARVAITAFLAHTIGQTLGFAALTGGAVRLRGYSKVGLSLIEIGQIVLMSALGFIFGAWVLLGLALALEPATATPILPLDTLGIRSTGIALLAAFLVMLWLVNSNGREFGIGRQRFWIPDRRTVLGVTALSIVELVLACAAFYVLLPSEANTSFFGFIGLWLVAVVAGLISTVPAGLGVFEWSMLKLLPHTPPSVVLAAALAYRITYYVLPTLIALTMAASSGLRQPMRVSAGTAIAIWKTVRPWAPQIIALAVFAIGTILLVDGTLPTPKSRQEVAPLPLIETSHLLVSLGGIVLLLIGQGLQRRSHSAWLLALGICILLPPLALLRGSHYSVSLWAGLTAVTLWMARREFYRQSALLDEAWSWRWLSNIGIVIVSTFWLVFFVYSHVEYSNDLWWEFATSGNAPRALRALLLICICLIVFGMARLLHNALQPFTPASEAELQALLPILANNKDTKACLAMTGDKALLHDPQKHSFVMMQRYGGSLIAMGDPIGPPEAAIQLIWRFREVADRLGLRPVFYQVSDNYWKNYLDLGMTMVKIGEEAIVDLEKFSLEGPTNAEMRQAFNKGKRLGLRFRILSEEEVRALIHRLRQISDEWLEEKGSEEKSFSLGNFDPIYLYRFPVAVIEHEAEQKIIAFANILKAQPGSELSIDLMRYSQDAPNGTMDFLFVAMLLWGKEQGFQRFSLGMAPLSGLAQHHLAGRWNRFANLIARHGERFYGFSGLRRFKAKFSPNWCPRYLAAPGGMHIFAALLDVTRLISISPKRREDNCDQI
ncbi:MAG TPA: bifunctional lysylphosphatidylglycerol flippase/synthetase MprF [Xylella fastidiosa subsp. multiplex]